MLSKRLSEREGRRRSLTFQLLVAELLRPVEVRDVLPRMRRRASPLAELDAVISLERLVTHLGVVGMLLGDLLEQILRPAIRPRLAEQARERREGLPRRLAVALRAVRPPVVVGAELVEARFLHPHPRIVLARRHRLVDVLHDTLDVD